MQIYSRKIRRVKGKGERGASFLQIDAEIHPVVKSTAYDHGHYLKNGGKARIFSVVFGCPFSKLNAAANERGTKAMNSPMTVRLTSVFLVGAVLKSTLHLYTPSSLFLTSSRLSLEWGLGKAAFTQVTGNRLSK